MSNNTPLRISTSFGPILGFKDPSASSQSSSEPISLGQDNAEEAPVLKWLGIPYASARRWERPQPAKPWDEPRCCTQFGPCFPQTPSLVDLIYHGKPGFSERKMVEESEENGFNLNVFVSGTHTESSQPLPVMVWIYGGSLEGGRSASRMYDPSDWIRREAEAGRHFFVVTGNYRCNSLGFMACQDLADEDPDGLVGNYGTYDCISILKWVQNNIANFGGNPNNVTLFGESAGAFLIGALLVTQEKLFQRVIMQSGFPETLTHRDVGAASNTNFYQSLCDYFSLSGDLTASERLLYLRKVPSSKLVEFMQARGSVINDYGLTIENPYSSKSTWPKPAIELMKEGKWNPHLESVMMGHTKDEGSIFAYFFQTPTKSGYENVLSKRCPFASRDEIDSLYQPCETDGDLSGSEADCDPVVLASVTNWKSCVGSRLISHQLCESPMENLAFTLERVKNHQTDRHCKLYVYQLNEIMPSVGQGLDWGSFHTIDLPLLFNIKTMWKPESNQAKTSARMGKLWVNFAINGIPDPNWPEYLASSSPLKFIIEEGGKTQIEDTRGTRSEIEKRKIDFWIDKLPQIVTFRKPPILA